MTDLTADGRVDVVVPTGRAVAVLHVDGAGVLRAEQWVPGSRDDVGGGNQSVSAVEPADVDGDGRLDLVSALAMTNGGSRRGEPDSTAR
ncbi:MAG: VCBS repeat-containing protein [Acidimicrobiales bacterium]